MNLLYLKKPAFFIFALVILFTINVSGQVVINEICPTNISINQNSNGDYDDWIELHNSSGSSVNLNGFGLTDDPSKPFRFKFPSYTLSAGGKVIVFASDVTNEVIAHHWEMAVDAASSWKYAPGSSSLDSNWRNLSFTASGWSSGNAGIGFGDGDDATTISIGASVMMRKTFTIPDTSQILKGVLMMDYDDGFVAYLNGVEIARANLGQDGYRPLWNQLANSSHEALRYQGLPIDSFFIDRALLKSIIRPGTNVLAVEVHNTPANNNDLSSIPYLFFGMKSSGATFSSIPSWFHVPSTEYFNAHFKMARTGETVYLYNPNGTIADQKLYPAMESNNSYCRKPDGSSSWCYVSTPTPNASNNSSTCYTGYANFPVFSISGGYYNSTQTLTLLNTTPGGVIRYTTNGNTPTTSSPQYTSPITISSTKTIRAKVFATGYLPSPMVTNTYIINGSTHLSSFSITTDSSNLWDWNTGIYVMGPNAQSTSPYKDANFWQNWEKPATIEYFDRNKNPVARFDADIKIFGNYSRAKPQKSFEIKLSDKYGLGTINYPMWPEKPYIDKIDDILLRNAGTDWNKVHFRDGYMERLMKNTYTGYLSTEPCIAYLNGQYWGVYHINEVHDNNWINNNFGYGKNDIDYLIEGGSSMDVKEGSDATFWTLYNYATGQNPNTQAYYDYVSTLLDIQNFADYFIVETYVSNGDWIGDWTNNIKLWRPHSGKWRYLLYDLDMGFGYGGISSSEDKLEIARNPAAFSHSSEMFDDMLKNPTFKSYFINRYADLINTIFLPANVDAVMHSYKDTMAFDMVNHFAKWGSSTSTWNSNITSMMNFANARPAKMRDFIKSQFSLTGKVTITLQTNPANAGRIEISTITPTTYPWTGTYFNGNPVKITAIPNPGYTFDHFKSNVVMPSNNYNSSVTFNYTANDVVTAYFTGSSSPAKLSVSELNYNSKPTNNAGDWIELHNFGTTVLDISGWQLRDGNDNHRYTIPTGTQIAPNGYLVLVEDTDNFKLQFPTVNNRIGPIGFNFSNGGDQVRLFNHTGALYLSFYYQDLSPWPIEADGNGFTCELTADLANPNNGSSWFPGCIGGSPGRAYSNSLNIPVAITGNTTFCSGGNATLKATSVTGYTYQWKLNNLNINGATDSVFVASQAGNYSVTVTFQGCATTTPGTSVSVVAQQPAPVTTPDYRCGPGDLTLYASSSDSVFWYDAPSGGNLVWTGDTMITPFLTSTTTYYARTGQGVCASNAVACAATILNAAAPPVTNDATRCGPGTVTLTATDTAQIRWYNAPSGGGLLQTGSSFTTNILNNDTSYFVEAGSVCPSPRIEVHVTVSSAPVPTVFDGSRCGNGTVTLTANSPSPITWFTQQYNGSSVGSGTSYTTPSLSQTDTLWVQATAAGCPSARVRCIAIVNPIPPVPSVHDSAICNPGSVLLTATATEQVNWYDAPTGGNLVYTGSNFVTPSLTSTTTYYADNGYVCFSPRVAVQAIISTPPAAPLAPDVTRCGPGTVSLSATSPETIYWYDAPSGGNLLATGASYTTPVISNSTTYYVETGDYCRSLRTSCQAIIGPLPAAPSVANVSRCGSGTVDLTAVSGQTVYWYSSSTGNNLLFTGPTFTTPNISSTTTYYVEAGTANCRSNRVAVQAVISQTPSAPSVTNGNRCGPGTVNLSASSSSAISWFDVPSGGSPIATGNSFTTPSLSNTTTYYVEANNGCASNRATVQAVINAIPAAPVTSNVSRCGTGTVTLSATSPEQIYWYANASGGSALGTGTSFTTPSISSTTTYYVETGDVCRSARIPVQAIVNSNPSSPSLTSGSNCGPGTVTLTASSSHTVNWYSTSSGGSSIGTGLSFTTPPISNTTTYYAEAVNSSGCSSNRISVQAQIVSAPNAPNASNNSRCGTGTVTLTATSSSTVSWYSSASGGSPIGTGLTFTTPSISATTTYYAEANNGCASTRTAVQAIIDPIPAPPVTNNVSRCGNGTVTLTATSPEQIYWYAAASGGSSLATGPSLTTPSISSTTTYYVETGNNCRSNRISVQAIVVSNPSSPTATGGSHCGPGTVTLNATSSLTINWYQSSSGGSPLGTGLSFTTPSISATTTYYAEAVNSSGCASTRTSVQAVISSAPNPPVAPDVPRCGPGTVTLSAASSSTVSWFSTPSGGTALGSGLTFTTPSLSATTTYYAEANNGCSSTRTSVDAVINALPAPPATANVSRCGNGTVTLNATSPETIYWYTVSSGGSPVTTGSSFTTPSISVTTTYYVETGDNCRSSRIPVQAVVIANPSAPVLTSGSHCGPGTVVLTASSSLPVTWYSSSSGGSPLGTGLTFTTPSINSTTTYYAEVENSSGCVSTRSSVQAVIGSIPSAPATNDNSRCGPGTVTVTATSSATVSWYQNATGGSALGTGLSFTTPSISTTTTFYAEAISNGCSSTRTPVQAIVNPVPAPPIASGASRCGTGTLTLNALSTETIYWYTVATGGSSVSTGPSYTTPSISTSTTYYVETGDNCRSSRIPVLAAIISNPSAPVLTSGNRCGPGTVTLTASSASTVTWYSTSSGGTPLGTGLTFTTPSISSTTTYYAETENASGCVSTRSSVQAVINSIPAGPVTIDNSRCGPGTVTVSATSSSTVNWYQNATGGSSLGSGLSFTTPSINVTTTYYAEAVNNGCSSIRIPVQAIINAQPAPPIASGATRCGTGTLTLNALATETIYWYSVPSGGSSIATGPSFTTPSISSTTTYYVEDGDNCRSNRIPVQATVVSNPTAPVLTSGFNCGPGTVILNATSTSQVYWYTASTGGSPVASGLSFTTPSLTATTTYYAQAENAAGCTSSRVSVQALISSIPAAPVGTGGSSCGSGQVDLSATGSGQLYWYSSLTGSTPLDSGTTFETPNISTSTTYYVAAGNGNCYSTRISVQAVINAIPAAPTGPDVSRCGPGVVVLNATASGQIYWYSSLTSSTVLDSGSVFTTPSITTTKSYYAETQGVCKSVRERIRAIITSQPNSPALFDTTRCGPGTAVIRAVSSDQVNWYSLPSGGTLLGTGLIFTTPFISANTTFYAEAGIGCNSSRVPVDVDILPQPAPPSVTDNTRCGIGSVMLHASSSQNIFWYDSLSGGNLVGTGSSFVTPALMQTTTYYVETGNSCRSNRVPVHAIIGGSQVNQVNGGYHCGNASVVLSVSAQVPNDSIMWYDQPGGTILGTGAFFITPNISSTTTYYVTANSVCTGAPVAVTAFIYPQLVFNFVTDTVHIQSGQPALLDAGPGYSSYFWSTGETSSSILVYTGGDYSVSVTDSNGCSATDFVYVDVFTGIKPVTSGDLIKVYPNPAHDMIMLSYPDASAKSLSVKLISAEGKIVLHEEMKPSSGHLLKTISLAEIAKGVYFLSVENDAISSTVKVIVE